MLRLMELRIPACILPIDERKFRPVIALDDRSEFLRSRMLRLMRLDFPSVISPQIVWSLIARIPNHDRSGSDIGADCQCRRLERLDFPSVILPVDEYCLVTVITAHDRRTAGWCWRSLRLIRLNLPAAIYPINETSLIAVI